MIPGGDLPGRSAPRFAWPASCEAALLLLLLVGLRFVEMEQLPPAVEIPKMMAALESMKLFFCFKISFLSRYLVLLNFRVVIYLLIFSY